MSIEKVTKRFTFKAVDTGDRTFTAVINTDTLDRDDEVVLPDGMNSSEFDKSPTVFWNHDYSKPIARCMKLSRGYTEWTAQAKIADKPADWKGDWFPDEVYSLIKQGVVNGTSIGFLPTEVRNPTQKDIERWGPKIRRVISKWKMLEFSVTPLPANHDALITACKALSVSGSNVVLGVEEPRRVVHMHVTVPSEAQRKSVLKSGKLWI
jgi:HK97 family phage prohead protease